MGYKATSLTNLINMKNRTLFLPHIQRPFVWEWEQVIRFIDSLMKNYPIQTFLFWKTNDQIKARRFMDNTVEEPNLSDYYDQNASERGREKIFVLDGQQRLQSLFGAFDGTFDGKDLYINILDGDTEIENGVSYHFEKSNDNLELPFLRMKSFTSDRRNAEDIADELNNKLQRNFTTESPTEKTQRERKVRRNVSQLVSLLREDKYFWIEELDGIASDYFGYKTVLNVFVRVNSGGTKLSRGDLMFAAMKESWADIEQSTETVVDNLNSSGNLFFDKDFVLKGLKLAAGKGSSLSSEEFYAAADADANLNLLRSNWPQAEQAFQQLRDFVYNDLKVYSDKVVRSYNAFIPIFEFFFNNPSPTPQDKELLKSYYYRSQLFNWYSAGTDRLLDAVHNIIAKSKNAPFPLGDVKAYFGGQSKDIDLSAAHLQDIRLRFILLNLIYVEQIGHSPFDVAYKGNEPHIDHIYPKSKLSGYATSEVNHLGNYRYIGAAENLRKRAEEPSAYFSRLKSAGVDISRHLLVDKYAQFPNLLTMGDYLNFRDERLIAILGICARVVNR